MDFTTKDTKENTTLSTRRSVNHR